MFLLKRQTEKGWEVTRKGRKRRGENKGEEGKEEEREKDVVRHYWELELQAFVSLAVHTGIQTLVF